MSKRIPINHEIDAAWILAIWRAIHGGDPAWQKTTLEIIATLTATWAGDTRSSSGAKEITSKLKEIGINFEMPQLKADSVTPVAKPNDRIICVTTTQGKRICFTKTGPPPWKSIQES